MVDSEAKLSINNKIICFSDFHQTPKEVGQRVICIINKHLRSGVTKFIGTTHFSEGVWCGIVLDEPFGKNDGSVKGVRYFTCGENYGIFVHVKKVRAICENDLGFLPQTETDVVDCRESPDSRTVKNADINLKMNAGTVECKSEHQEIPCDEDANSNITSRACNMIHGLKKSELSTNFPKGFTKNDIKESGIRSGIYPTGQLSDNDRQSKQDSYSELCNGVNSVHYEEADPCCEDISRQNINTKSGLQVCCIIEHQEKKNLICEDMTNSTKHKSRVSNQCNSMIHKRSFSSDYIIVDKKKLTKDSSSPGLHASLEKNETIDPFVQGKYCSCPSLVPSQHLSSALETCIDLGRQELESSSVKSSPEEEKHLDEIQLEESSPKDGLNDDNMFKGNLYQGGRSLSLPLVLVPVQHISQTESLFWSLEKVSETLTKVERAESWPTLSTSLCNLDLRPDVNQDASFGLSSLDSDCKNNCGQGMLADDCVLKEDDNDDDKNLKKIMRISVVEQVRASIKTNNNCQSNSGSQASVSSDGTTESQKSIQRKISASSTSSSNSQSKKVKLKPQRNSKSKPFQKFQGKTDMIGIKVNPERTLMTLKLDKRHTLSGLEDMQSEVASKTSPSLTKRPASTLFEPAGDSSPMSSPSFAKSKLPTMRKTVPPSSVAKESTSAASKPQPKGSLLQKGRGTTKEKKKSTASTDKNKITSKGKVSTFTPFAQKTGKNQQVTQVSRRGKPSTQSGGSGPVDKKPVTSTKTTIIPSPKPSAKPLKLQAATKGSPTGKTAGSPSKHYQSRLPRKIISRDTSTDSGHSHEYECDVDTASIGTDGSDYFDGDKLARSGSFPPEQHYDGDKSDLESSTKSWVCPSHAPDILTGTREIHTRCAEVQVQMSEGEFSREMNDKLAHAEDLLVLKDKQCRDLKAAVGNSNTDILASALLFVILCKKLQNNGRLIMQLKKQLHSTESNLKQVQERLVEEEANGVRLQEELMYVRSEHTVAVQNLKADHENTLEALRYNMKKQFAEEQKKAADEHVAELLELNKVHEEKVTAVKKKHEKDEADLHEKYKDEIVELESKQSHHIDELLEEHQVEIETIKSDYEEQHNGLESKLFAATDECTSLTTKLQQLQEETERDIELRIQDAIEKYKSLPAELESMKAVLDMKNEEIKQLRKEQMESKLELDHLRKVADRAKKLQYENESLSFVVENKSKFERQLSVEREQLKNTLDRESKKLKRLSLENEELQWRLSNSSSPPDGGIPPDGMSELPSSSSHRRSFRLSSSSDVDTINE